MKDVVILLSLGLLLSACSGQLTKPGTSLDTPYPDAKIGFAMSGDKGEFFSEAARSFKKIAGEHSGISLVMEEAGQNADVQAQQIEKIANSGVQAMIFHLVNPSSGPEIIQKYCNKFPLVFFNRSPGEKALATCPNAYFVDGDASQAGILLGLKILKKWEENPSYDKNKDGVIQYALVETTPDWIAGKLRGNWTVGTMKSYPNLGKSTQQLFIGYGGFDNETGRNLANSWIAQPNFNNVEVIIATTELSGIGVVQALDQHGLKVPLFTIDDSDNGFAAIKSGKIVGGTGHDFDAEAKTVIRMAANLANKKPALDGIRYEMYDKEIAIPYIDMNASGK